MPQAKMLWQCPEGTRVFWEKARLYWRTKGDQTYSPAFPNALYRKKSGLISFKRRIAR